MLLYLFYTEAKACKIQVLHCTVLCMNRRLLSHSTAMKNKNQEDIHVRSLTRRCLSTGLSSIAQKQCCSGLSDGERQQNYFQIVVNFRESSEIDPTMPWQKSPFNGMCKCLRQWRDLNIFHSRRCECWVGHYVFLTCTIVQPAIRLFLFYCKSCFWRNLWRKLRLEASLAHCVNCNTLSPMNPVWNWSTRASQLHSFWTIQKLPFE